MHHANSSPVAGKLWWNHDSLDKTGCQEKYAQEEKASDLKW